MKNKRIQYFVEGEDEKRIINTLKSELMLIKSGNVQVLNVVEATITRFHLRMIKPDTVVVLVFDTDTGNTNILKKNLKTLNSCSAVSEIVVVPQVTNLEDELVRSCNIRRVEDLLNSKSKSEFKSDLLRVTNLDKKLREHGFDIQRFWSEQPPTAYQEFENQSMKIKLSR